jgi:hypothetical protein
MIRIQTFRYACHVKSHNFIVHAQGAEVTLDEDRGCIRRRQRKGREMMRKRTILWIVGGVPLVLLSSVIELRAQQLPPIPFLPICIGAGCTGPQGAGGPTGPTGPQGPSGPPGSSGVQFQVVACDNLGPGAVSQCCCPFPKQAIAASAEDCPTDYSLGGFTYGADICAPSCVTDGDCPAGSTCGNFNSQLFSGFCSGFSGAQATCNGTAQRVQNDNAAPRKMNVTCVAQ